MEKVQTKITPNAKQQECIDTIKGTVMVLAGPGTGKTFVVIERIKNMLNKGVEPNKILCLTFSEAAASEMKRRLIQKAGINGSRVNVYTYHGFCYEIIQNYSEYFEEFSNFNIINPTQQRALLRQCLEEIDIKEFKTSSGDRYFYASEILSRIEDIKKNLLTRDVYFNNLENHPEWGGGLKEAKIAIQECIKTGKKVTKTLEKKIREFENKIFKARELWKIFELYSLKMRQNGFMDFSDMIALVLMKFLYDADFLETIAKEYDYFLVDEYQDTNNAQNMLVFALNDAKEEKNLFVVGDDDQIIYGFQGAQVDNLERFLKKYPQTKVICLEENMRSTQSILDLSEQVAMLDPNRLESNYEFKQYNIKKHLTAKNSEICAKDKKPVFSLFEDVTQEYNAIVDEIERIIKEDNPKLNEIAILTRSNADLCEFCELLKGRNIPYELKDGKSIFEVKSSLLTIFYLKMLLNHTLNSDKIFPLLLSEPFCIDIHDYNDLLAKSYLHKNREFISDLYDLKKNGKEFKNPERIEKFINDFEYLNEAKGVLNIYQLVLEVVNRTGILEYFIKCDINREENISAIKKIVDEAKAFLSVARSKGLQEFIEYLDDSLENGNPIPIAKSPIVKNAVQLVTLHSSKGREFEYVFIPGLEEYKWERTTKDSITSRVPISKVITEEDKENLKISEKVKLLFVGITRAKHYLMLSAPKKVNSKDRKLTKYITQIPEEFLDIKENVIVEKNYLEELTKSVKYEYDYKKDFQNFIQSSIENLSISASMMNMYLKCPRQFLYNYVLRLNTFSPIDDILNYGNVIHKTIEDFTKHAKSQGFYPSKEEFLAQFNQNMQKMPFSTRGARENTRKKGEENLEKYYNQLISTPLEKVYSSEQTIEAKIGTEIKINGKIDRLELNDDGTFSIIDFKTGAAKNKYTIKEGGAHEGYLNQLKFYKYLVEKKYENKATKATLVFVDQCDENYHAEMNEFNNETFEQKIKDVYSDICAQKFEPPTDNSAPCEFCSYRQFCNLNLL